MPEDASMWPQQVLEELHKQCPYLGIYEVDTHIEKINPTQSTALGFFIVRPSVTPETTPPEQSLPQVKVPIIINDRLLSPFDIMVSKDNQFMPLTESRVKQALEYASPMELYIGDNDGLDQMFRPKNQGMFSNLLQGVGNGFFMDKFGQTEEGMRAQALEAAASNPAREFNLMSAIQQRLDGLNARGIDDQNAKMSAAREALSEVANIPHVNEVGADPRVPAGVPSNAGVVTSSKTASLLSALNGKVDRTTAKEFIDSMDERVLHSVLYKTANRQAIGIVGQRVLDLVKTAQTIEHAPSPEYPITPNVLLLERVEDGYRVKVADTAAYIPVESKLTSIQAQALFGNEALEEADKIGAMVFGPRHAITEAPSGMQKVAEVLGDAPAGGFAIMDVHGRRHEGAVFRGYERFDGYHDPGVTFLSKTANAFGHDFFGIGDPGVLPPDDAPGQGARGMFYNPNTLQALEPVLIKTAVTGIGTPYWLAEDNNGAPIKISPVEGIAKVAKMGERHYAVPNFFKFAAIKGEFVQPVDKEVLLEQAFPQTIKIAHLSDGKFSISGAPVESIPRDHREGVDLADAMFALRSVGLSFDQSMEKLAEAASKDHSGTVEVRGDFLHITPYADRQASYMEYVTKCASVLPGKPPLDDLVKIAAILEDGTTVDSVLSLGFIKPDTLATFVEYLPTLEQATHNLAELLFAVRLGVSYVPEVAAARGMSYVNTVVEGLNQLKQTTIAGGSQVQ